MSGVEVAGLVLGCLPLIIQGIESYNEGLDPIKSFVRWERELPQFIRKLRNQHVHYAQTIRILFEPITTDAQLAEMMADPGSTKLWKESDLGERLQDRLQESYEAYQGTIGDIERITKKIASKLDLERATELSRNDLEAILAANPKKGSSDKFELGKRIRFGMNKKAIKALLEELDDCNKELERFTEKSEKIETFRKTVKPAFATRIQRIQGYAKSLHSSLLWCCSCKSSHQTSLQLDARGNLFATGVKKSSSKTCFNVAFVTTPTSEEQDGLWTWKEAEIHVEEEDDFAPPPPSPNPKISKTVSFGSPPPYSVTDPSGSLVVDSTASPTLQEVKDLCQSIAQIHDSHIGFSLDSKSKLRGAYSLDKKGTPTPSSAVTLADLLDHPPVVNGRRAKLSKKERYNLALTLASSVLYLNSTPWLVDQWAAKNIVFHTTAASGRLADIEHPYVTPLIEDIDKKVNAKPMRGMKNKNTVLLALAVALLELYFGTTAEKYQEDEHGTIDPSIHQNAWLLCAMAHNWAEDAQDDLSAAFLSAVTHCLKCFGDPVASLKDSDFLQAAVEGIVLPIQEELHQFLGKTIS